MQDDHRYKRSHFVDHGQHSDEQRLRIDPSLALARAARGDRENIIP